ncbi:DUF2285 domain-containing protein [Sphingobium phenoxybenzoativorans]|uniref:DUF2285 domain-containing protein n=1 Tax=Sphingobium phenoxybenzoativorans TaxID=1592790 RepID=UPI000872328B|nr:DUF2285 domain-containing protein [Sphingobium phenoxybenzoativorans]
MSVDLCYFRGGQGARLMPGRPLSRAAIMWEWQRRDPAYIAFATGRPAPRATFCDGVIHLAIPVDDDAAPWGCVFAEAPENSAETARLFWTHARDPAVIRATAIRARSRGADSFDIAQLREHVVHTTDSDGHEQLLVGSTASCLRLDIVDGSLLDGPVNLTCHISDFDAAAPGLRAIRRLHQLQKTLCLPQRPSINPQLWCREIERLQAFDALQSGATQREIGALIFGRAAVDYGWNSHTDRVRSAVKRLLRDARTLAAGGYRTMLL